MGIAENKKTSLMFLEAARTGNSQLFLSLITDDMVSWIPPSCEKIVGYPTVVRGAKGCYRLDNAE